MVSLNVTPPSSLVMALSDGLLSSLLLPGDLGSNSTSADGTSSPPLIQNTTFSSLGNLTSAASSFLNNESTTAAAAAPETVLVQRIAKSIDFWFPPFLFLIGTVANVFVIMVMRSKDFRHMSTSFYMAISSVFDMASLVVSLPAHYLAVNFPQIFDPVRDAHSMCAFFQIFGWGSSDMGVLLTVAMTTERSLAIHFPLKAPSICTVKRAKIVSTCLFFLELAKVAHFFYGSRVASKEVTAYLCGVDLTQDRGYAIFYKTYWPYLHNIFLVVAFVVIIIGNVIITVHVKRSEGSKDMGDMAKSAGGGAGAAGAKKLGSKSRQLSLMLIIDSATIVLCTLPFSIYVVLDSSFSLFPDTPQGRGYSSLAFSVVFYLLYVNRCANFFLYCVSGERFRRTLTDLMRGSSAQKRRKQQNYITGATRVTSTTAATLGTGAESGAVSMNPMGPSTISGSKVPVNSGGGGPNGRRRSSGGQSSGVVSMSPGGGGTASASDAPPPRLSKMERHYGYGQGGQGK